MLTFGEPVAIHFPNQLHFDTADDYIEFIGKKHEWKAFLKCSNLILYQFPKLKDWIIT